jgi:hypothetical protein
MTTAMNELHIRALTILGKASGPTPETHLTLTAFDDHFQIEFASPAAHPGSLAISLDGIIQNMARHHENYYVTCPEDVRYVSQAIYHGMENMVDRGDLKNYEIDLLNLCPQHEICAETATNMAFDHAFCDEIATRRRAGGGNTFFCWSKSPSHDIEIRLVGRELVATGFTAGQNVVLNINIEMLTFRMDSHCPKGDSKRRRDNDEMLDEPPLQIRRE